MRNIRYVFIGLFLLCGLTIKSQNFKELTPGPPMGWNSWNWFGKKEINENVVRECIDAIVKEGLKDAGYDYVIIDGGWRDVKLGANGELVTHPIRFPGGIKSLADYAHSKGLKFGLHTVPGTHDCGGDKVGGYNLEELHIQQFIDWGLDFVKVDRCVLALENKKCKNCWDEDLTEKTYRKWRNILDKKQSNMVLSISAYVYRNWNPEISNMSRTTLDIGCRISKGAIFNEAGRKNHFAVLKVADENNKYAEFAGNGYWNDPDMLVTGGHGLSYEEEKAHFALWCIMSSPLLLGNDPRNMSDEEKSIIFNKEAIAINQDPTEQGKKRIKNGDAEIWLKNLSNGDIAVLLLNRDPEKAVEIILDWKSVGLYGKKKVYDVYDSKYLGKHNKSVLFEIGPNSCKFLTIRSK